MQFDGQLCLQEESGPGLGVRLRIADDTMDIAGETESLGTWPLSDVTAKRLSGDRFSVTLGEEEFIFVAEDSVAFAYDGLAALSEAPRRQSRSGMLQRLRSRRGASDEPRPALTIVPSAPPEPAPAPVLEPDQEPEPPPARPAPVIQFDFDAAEHSPAPPPPSSAPASFVGSDPALFTVDDLPSATTKPPAQSTCRAQRLDGQPCRATILGTSGFCFAHDPSLSDARDEARRGGATARPLPVSLPVLRKLFRRLERAAADIQSGKMDPRAAVALASIAQAMIETLRADDARRPSPPVEGDGA